MKTAPLISIITVNLNNFKGLKKTMASVLDQSWQEFEYIVIDGGSNDGSKDYIESQSQKLDYWVSEPDKGVYNAMNKGVKRAAGEYLLFLNSGDHFVNKEVLGGNRRELAFSDLIYFNIKVVTNEETHIVSYPEQLGFTDLFYGTLCHQAVFIKKDIFNKVGFYDENLKIVADWKLFILALFKFNCSYRKVDKLLTVYYSDGLSADSKNEPLILSEREGVLQNNFQNFQSEIDELCELRKTFKYLRKSKKINMLIKLRLLNKF
ncbi:glycosyltransferase [Salegentibacter sp. LM13S]|uniref:glycosyltransferase family 2 protein n=1 Tax=Salegentibacter lacus TaxID=2873599 RepID=UPI001CCD2E59|nr:glycosyltransferase family 2 protein [Salegentibacter lacus]MBZ9632354.1 glycosyltransferase [Salegentibacter lacus]